MPLVATLISDPERPAVTTALADRARGALSASAAVRWLAPGIACDIAVPDAVGAERAADLLAELVGDEPIDVAVQEAGNRRRRILIADMDSTMIEQECIDELADEVGLKAKVAEITARSMNGEIAFEPALRERVALLKGLASAVVEKVLAERIRLARGGRTLVATMNAAGAHTALVSGGFQSFTRPVAALLGFAEQRANTLIEEDGRLAGLVAEPILGRAAKAEALTEIAARLGLKPADAIAVGDGANDLDMIRLAGTGVAIHAKPVVAAAAPFRIDHGDLTALLYLQGFSRDEFAG